MRSLVPAGTIVEFRPQPEWRWVAFDGCVEVSASRDRVELEGHGGIVDEDLVRLAASLVGRQYAAEGYDDVPGTIGQAAVEIDRPTLFHRVVIEGCVAAWTATTGTFRVVCQPSMKAAIPPVPDPLLTHEGTWTIREPAVARTECRVP
jgi:hypothetical protein